MLTLSQKIEHLKRCPLFGSLSFDQLKVISMTSSEITCRAGEILFREGDEASDAYVIFEGETEVFKDIEGGEAITLATLGKSDIFGEFAIISRCPRTAGVKVTKDLHALKIGRDSFLDIIRHFPEVSVRIMDILVRRLLAVQNKYISLLSGKEHR